MKLAFVINRLGDNKWFAPLIRESLVQGHSVELWLNQRDISQTTKWYESPKPEKLPRYHESLSPALRAFETDEELGRLYDSGDREIVFSNFPPKCAKPKNQIWAHVITSLDDSLWSMTVHDLNRFDAIFTNAKHWINDGLAYYRATKQTEPDTAQERELLAKWFITGTPQFDHFSFCNREETRRKLNIPEGKKIVTVFAFETNTTFWCQKIFLEDNTLKRYASLLILPFSYTGIFSKIGKAKLLKLAFRSLYDRFYFIKEAICSVSERDVLLAIKKFCEENNALLVLKARKKHSLKPYHLSIPDRLIEGDTEYFPCTPYQLMHASDLMITFYSVSGVESASSGVPVLNLAPPKNSYYTRHRFELQVLHGAAQLDKQISRFFKDSPGSVFQFDGVIRTCKVNQVAHLLQSTRLENFHVLPGACQAYRIKFVSQEAGPSSPRILSMVERVLLARN